MARPGSKTLDGRPTDDNPNLLNFTAVESYTAYWMSSRFHMYWSDSGKLDCPVWHSVWSSFTLPNVNPTFFVLGQEDVDGGLWALLRLVPLVLLPLVIIQTFWLDHPHRPFFSYEDLLALGLFGMR